MGNLGQGAESHVGEPTITSDGPAHGDAGDTGRDDHVNGREYITSAHLIEDGPERHDGSGTRLREQDSTHDRTVSADTDTGARPRPKVGCMPARPGHRPFLLLEMDLTELPAEVDPDDPLVRLRARGRPQLRSILRALHEAAADRHVVGLIAKVGGALPWATMQLSLIHI